jgi:hypothetical protein
LCPDDPFLAYAGTRRTFSLTVVCPLDAMANTAPPIVQEPMPTMSQYQANRIDVEAAARDVH